MMEEANKESIAIKDKKIATLEHHLTETRNLNSTLHRQLDTMQKEYQAYMDRRKEEATPSSTTITVQPTSGKQSSSISQLVIKKPVQVILIYACLCLGLCGGLFPRS